MNMGKGRTYRANVADILSFFATSRAIIGPSSLINSRRRRDDSSVECERLWRTRTPDGNLCRQHGRSRGWRRLHAVRKSSTRTRVYAKFHPPNAASFGSKHYRDSCSVPCECRSTEQLAASAPHLVPTDNSKPSEQFALRYAIS